MVAVDDAGRPAAVPPFAPQTPLQRKRHRAAEIRRTLRREIQDRLAAVAEHPEAG
jgi:acyl-CoA hydrolase